MPKYKIELWKMDKKLLELGAGKPKKLVELVEWGITHKPCDSVVVYEWTGMMGGYKILKQGEPNKVLKAVKAGI